MLTCMASPLVTLRCHTPVLAGPSMPSSQRGSHISGYLFPSSPPLPLQLPVARERPCQLTKQTLLAMSTFMRWEDGYRGVEKGRRRCMEERTQRFENSLCPRCHTAHMPLPVSDIMSAMWRQTNAFPLRLSLAEEWLVVSPRRIRVECCWEGGWYSQLKGLNGRSDTRAKKGVSRPDGELSGAGWTIHPSHRTPMWGFLRFNGDDDIVRLQGLSSSDTSSAPSSSSLPTPPTPPLPPPRPGPLHRPHSRPPPNLQLQAAPPLPQPPPQPQAPAPSQAPHPPRPNSLRQSRSTRDPGTWASGLHEGARPHPAFAGPGAYVPYVSEGAGGYNNNFAHVRGGSDGAGAGVGAGVQRGVSLNHNHGQYSQQQGQGQAGYLPNPFAGQGQGQAVHARTDTAEGTSHGAEEGDAHGEDAYGGYVGEEGEGDRGSVVEGVGMGVPRVLKIANE
ncbi:hypothetical protein FPV67DRAFT_1786385 [Lyophyllum atratum]|nr:hypothetical protein FPV67DRAFT_1786385 [Lyophyllum atratum]